MDTITFLKENKTYLNIAAIEKKLSFPNGLIGKAIKGERNLSYEQQLNLFNLINPILSNILDKPISNPSESLPDMSQYVKVNKNIYKHKKTNEKVRIAWSNGAFRFVNP